MTREIQPLSEAKWVIGAAPTAEADFAPGSQLTTLCAGTGGDIQIYYIGKQGTENVISHASDSCSS